MTELVFYSAQEDQVPVPKDPKAQGTAVPSQAKKTQPPKRITNAMIAEQLGAMNAQLLLLSQRQDRLEKAGTTSAEVAPGPFAGQTSKLPAVSARLQNPSGVSQTVAAKALNLLGPPPKVRNLQPALIAEGAAQDEPYDVLQSGAEEPLGVAAALTQQSSAITALVAHLTAQGGDVLGDFTPAGNQSGSIRGVQRREKMQNELAAGTSNFFIQLMQQLHRRPSPIEASTAVRGGDFFGVNASVLGAPRRVPPQPGDGFGCLGVRSCDRCCCPRRSASHPRGSGSSHGCGGAVGAGSRGTGRWQIIC